MIQLIEQLQILISSVDLTILKGCISAVPVGQRGACLWITQRELHKDYYVMFYQAITNWNSDLVKFFRMPVHTIPS